MGKQCVLASTLLLVTLVTTTLTAQTTYTVTATNARLNREVTGDVVIEVVGDDGTAVPAEPVDAFVWDGVGSVPIAAADFHLEVDPIANTGEINVNWTDEIGVWEYKQTAFAPPPHPTGLRVSPDATQTELVEGDPITTNVFLHGNTGAAAPVLPTVFNLLATWGPAEVTLNGQLFNNPFDGPAPRWFGHTMTTPGVRNPDGTVRTTSGDIYVGPNPDGTPMTPADGVTDWDDMEVHFTWHDAPGPMTGNTPPPFSFFYHVVFEDVTIEIRHVPEPASIVLLLIGSLVVVARRRRLLSV